MQKRVIATILAAALTSSAAAQDDKNNWAISATGGTTTANGAGDQPFVSLGVTRYFGNSYARLTGTHIDSGGDADILSIIPASTNQLTLGAGTVTGALAIDGYVSVGDRSFKTQTYTTRTGRTILLDSGGSTFGAGLALTYEIPLGDSGVLAPFVAGDYSRISIARAILLPGGDTLGEASSEDGVTGSAGATAVWLFGPDQRHSVGLYGAALASSNNSSYNGTNARRATALGIGDQPGASDEWVEFGANGSFGLTDSVALSVGVIRTAGFLGPESTSVTGV